MHFARAQLCGCLAFFWLYFTKAFHLPRQWPPVTVRSCQLGTPITGRRARRLRSQPKRTEDDRISEKFSHFW